MSSVSFPPAATVARCRSGVTTPMPSPAKSAPVAARGPRTSRCALPVSALPASRTTIFFRLSRRFARSSSTPGTRSAPALTPATLTHTGAVPGIAASSTRRSEPPTVSA